MTALRRFYALACMTAALLPALRAATWQTTIKPGPTDNFTTAAFSLWLDESSIAPVGLLVIAPGWNGDGRDAIHDRFWQKFAREHRLGLIGVHLQSDASDEQTPPYHAPEHGSGKALLRAIEHLGQKAKRPELARAPLLFWGHSAGGQLGYGMACYAPDRVIGFAAIKGGVYLSKPGAATYRVPGLFIVGEQDAVGRAMNITWLFETGRAEGSPWCLAYESGSGHEIGKSNDLIIPFFKGILALRLARTGSGLNPITGADGWIGVRSSLETYPATKRTSLPQPRTVWLPDESTAVTWRGF